jgi:Xaa-Pro aminopeptidase
VAPDRLSRARALLPGAQVDALVVTRPEHVRYLAGFDGTSGALLIGASRAILVTDTRYAEQAASQAAGWSIEISPRVPGEAATALAGGGKIGFEAEAVTYAAWETMDVEAHDNGGGVLVPCRGLIEGLRAIKDADELAVMERAAAIAGAALAGALALVRPGRSEREVAQ